jgi:NAD(P)-dependent dehydrogenase (short-subunit alcohol dehydrogenase family)
MARNDVTVNYAAPGFIDTGMMPPYAKYREHMESQIPARRFAAMDEIAAVTRLMSPARPTSPAPCCRWTAACRRRSGCIGDPMYSSR